MNDDLLKRIMDIELLLRDYLKPNTRDDLDRLEQRFRRIELKLKQLTAQMIVK